MSCCSETSGEVVKDPVCGMQVDPAKAAGQSQYQGLTYTFCSVGCKNKFDLNPAQYMQSGKETPSLQPHSVVAPASTGASKVTKYTCPMHPEVQADKAGSCPKCGMALEPVDLSAATDRVEYTCPMHPQIVRDQPGSCPICGMALEPRNVSADSANPELVGMTRRFWISVALTLPLLAVMISDVLPVTRYSVSCPASCSDGSSLRLRHRWFSGRAGRSSSVAGHLSFIVAQICSR